MRATQSEAQSCADLNRARRSRARDHAEVGRTQRESRDVEVRTIQQVVRFDANIQFRLRDRPSDIRALAEYFAERAANRFGLRPVPVSDDDVRVLAEYRWPGNVREIAAVMDRAVLIGQGRALNVASALGQGTLTANPPLSIRVNWQARRFLS